ncbi:MAG TPA: aspartate-semialdehyde dehydrogenase [Candidatus Baltobacteraceae bacterium]|nr:aspartate-semialdehyde dehydrogenase [Candidatus Baltobacteraceae bacterium]
MISVAVVGATGVVGETIVRVLEERGVPVGRLGRFASRARDGVEAVSSERLRDFDVVFFASGEDASEAYAPAILERGAVVIDNSSTYRAQAGVPLVIPEVNPGDVRCEHRLFPVANCTAIILCMAMAPVVKVAGLRAIRVATYQAASGAGRAGLEELLAGERALAVGESEGTPAVFPQPLARNVLPQIGSFDGSGYSGEERKVAEEARKMLGLPELFVSATTVRVPVRTAHSEAVWFETERDTSVEALSAAFERAPGVIFHRDGIVTPREVEGTDLVHVARLRAESPGSKRHFVLWCVGDQLRKGAATNGVQILELLLARGYVG